MIFAESSRGLLQETKMFKFEKLVLIEKNNSSRIVFDTESLINHFFRQANFFQGDYDCHDFCRELTRSFAGDKNVEISKRSVD